MIDHFRLKIKPAASPADVSGRHVTRSCSLNSTEKKHKNNKGQLLSNHTRQAKRKDKIIITSHTENYLNHGDTFSHVVHLGDTTATPAGH